jgi:ParB family chromosome partitioning protein
MLMVAEQVCWVPISDIVMDLAEDAPSSQRSPDGEEPLENDRATVLLEHREEGGYQLLSGRERLMELKALGQSCVDAVISPRWSLEERISNLLSRLLKGEMHYLDEAEEYRRLLETGFVSRQELAIRLGRSLATIQKKLRLLSLGAGSRKELRERGLCERYAQALLRIPGDQGRARMAAHIAERELSVKEAEDFIEETIQRMPIAVPKSRKMVPVMRDHRLYVNAIRGIVEQMRDAGMEANMQVNTGTAVVEIRVTVPRVVQNRK